jgi:hypothetical protein
MEKSTLKFQLGLAVILGSVWGLSEAALGMGLKACASSVSGSLMTGVALFFIAAGWAATRRWFVPLLIVLVASCFKLFDALILALPVVHGAIGNPIFAFWLEGLAFVLLVVVFGRRGFTRRSSRMLLGGGSALIAVGLFPLVKFATTVPACLYPGTAVPLSIMFAPVAIVLSSVTVPLGFYLVERLLADAEGSGPILQNKAFRYLVSPATLVICLVLVFLFRLAVPMAFS